MATANIISELEHGLELERQGDLEAFFALAEAAARADRGEGQSPRVDDVKKCLEGTGKSIEDFRQATEIKKLRLRWAAQLDKADEARQAIDAAEMILATFNKEFAARYAADHAKQQELTNAVESARRASARCQEAELDLRRTSPDARPWLYETRPGQPTNLGRYMVDLQNRIRSLRAEVTSRESELEYRENTWTARFSPGAMKNLREELAERQKLLAELEQNFEQMKAAGERGIVPDEIALTP